MSNVGVDIAHTSYYLYVIRSSRYNSHVGVHISHVGVHICIKCTGRYITDMYTTLFL